jgi:hypothetical protein
MLMSIVALVSFVVLIASWAVLPLRSSDAAE